MKWKYDSELYSFSMPPFLVLHDACIRRTAQKLETFVTAGTVITPSRMVIAGLSQSVSEQEAYCHFAPGASLAAQPLQRSSSNQPSNSSVTRIDYEPPISLSRASLSLKFATSFLRKMFLSPLLQLSSFPSYIVHKECSDGKIQCSASRLHRVSRLTGHRSPLAVCR
jgi:hypothetical protein